MKFLATSWAFRAALSACFAALTAIFAKVGFEGVNCDFAIFGVIFLCEGLGPSAWLGIGLIGSGMGLVAFAA